MKQAIQLPAASAPELGKFTVEEFRGLDLTNAPNNVSKTRSPWAPNMIRDSVGKVRKWLGWHTVKHYAGKINGVYFLKVGSTAKKLVHAGTKLYLDGETPGQVYADMNDAFSSAVQMNGKLYILDGKTYLVYDGTTAQPVTNKAYVPTTVKGRAPNGGGKDYDPVNFLSAKRTNSFLGTADAKTYQLDFSGLSSAAVTARKKNADNAWVSLTENTDFTVDRATGKVTFTTAPGEPPVTGEDNVEITAQKTVDGYADRINKCRFAVLYGVNGAEDRIFMSGNPSYKNNDYYSEYMNPEYMGDTYYSMLGQDDSEVQCYAKMDNKLLAIKKNAASNTNLIIRTGTLTSEGKAQFPQVGSYQATGAAGSRTMCYIASEPVYLTEDGIMAVTPLDNTGERSAALRSYYINGSPEGSTGLLGEQGKENACACVYNRFYMLAINNKIYALDSSQVTTARNEPFSQRQYEGFLRLNIPARVIWEEEEALWFGTEDGRLCTFYTDAELATNYNDDGAAYECYWLTPEYSGATFYNKKRFSYIAARIAAAPVTGIRISAYYDGCEREVDGKYEILVDYGSGARYFSYRNLCYSKFTYMTYDMPRTLGGKIKTGKIDKIQFRLENSLINEPFGIYTATAEFTESGKYVK